MLARICSYVKTHTSFKILNILYWSRSFCSEMLIFPKCKWNASQTNTLVVDSLPLFTFCTDQSVLCSLKLDMCREFRHQACFSSLWISILNDFNNQYSYWKAVPKPLMNYILPYYHSLNNTMLQKNKKYSFPKTLVCFKGLKSVCVLSVTIYSNHTNK